MTTVNVTQEFIDLKHFCDSSQCPVALGLIAAFGLTKKDFVCAGPYNLGIRRKAFDADNPNAEQNDTTWVETPDEVREWMSDFDTEKPVEPFSFEIDFKGI